MTQKQIARATVEIAKKLKREGAERQLQPFYRMLSKKQYTVSDLYLEIIAIETNFNKNKQKQAV